MVLWRMHVHVHIAQQCILSEKMLNCKLTITYFGKVFKCSIGAKSSISI